MNLLQADSFGLVLWSEFVIISFLADLGGGVLVTSVVS